ncbi:uncharacterized protein B0I36DRAFT_119360 [Microdochium trichocladiopsis]|uniref:Uncharacterized protein n=1 Tax=Microdochium trichocladiopsis TaxID=1682393 RepID=A0A9P9BNE2_9PEZI|nr:uncharacterized protein B0I36DRAFT_119360 [Microdochium trichocladiopsis]KAH7031171.1 hypothetical protein B0I36DRAFT_119360 [Microdochium trichocladiopsis]
MCPCVDSSYKRHPQRWSGPIIPWVNVGSGPVSCCAEWSACSRGSSMPGPSTKPTACGRSKYLGSELANSKSSIARSVQVCEEPYLPPRRFPVGAARAKALLPAVPATNSLHSITSQRTPKWLVASVPFRQATNPWPAFSGFCCVSRASPDHSLTGQPCPQRSQQLLLPGPIQHNPQPTANTRAASDPFCLRHDLGREHQYAAVMPVELQSRQT